jgi:hypothetical protein
VQRIASQAAMFYLLSLWILRAGPPEGYPKARHMVDLPCSGCCRDLRMLTKENAYTLPLAPILIEICFFQSGSVPVTNKRFLVAAAVLVFVFIRFAANYSTQLNSNLTLDLGGTINSKNYRQPIFRYLEIHSVAVCATGSKP